ncbi:hypothetical protein FV222_01460 [Methylobacterium sp. WL103]|uniref:hypothetical protein n=1 Tax=Methylobacterium sp. WL103 TaxID=2603891 RepID=UPI0011D48A40|nr:hypothetical protein [Methylobacterium sp. WL103]TXN07933.1 hypothetical protein FV222_01460 [Methylobacterium sp. WL103]
MSWPMTPQQVTAEFAAVLSWSEEARVAYAKALASYRRAGSPGVPLGALDYQETYRKERRKRRRKGKG